MRILLAVDGSEPSDRAIRAVAERPWPEPSMVRLLTVIRPAPIAGWPPMTEFPGGPVSNDLVESLTKEAKQLLARASELLRRGGLDAEEAVVHGDARSVIVDEAKSWNADLIVVGSHGRTGLNRLILGSVAEYVVRHAHCSVEVVRARPNESVSRAPGPDR